MPTKPLPTVENILKSHGALDNLNALESAGCNRVHLLTALDLAFFAKDSWGVLVGMDLRRFKVVIREIRNCAVSIERLYRSELVYRLSVEQRDPLFVRIHETPTLPDQLRQFASAIEHHNKIHGPKLKIRGHTWKAWIVAMVITDTQKVHDREVSSLIGAVLDDKEYSEKAHQEWRRKNRDLLEIMIKKRQKKPR
jgi:hypothetical protein